MRVFEWRLWQLKFKVKQNVLFLIRFDAIGQLVGIKFINVEFFAQPNRREKVERAK